MNLTDIITTSTRPRMVLLPGAPSAGDARCSCGEAAPIWRQHTNRHPDVPQQLIGSCRTCRWILYIDEPDCPNCGAHHPAAP